MTDIPDRRAREGAGNEPGADLLPERYAELLTLVDGRRTGQPGVPVGRRRLACTMLDQVKNPGRADV